MKLYGIKNAGGTLKSQEKAKKTWMEKYGVENAAQAEQVKEKIRETNLKKHSKESYLATDECREITKQKCLDEYGVENYAQTDEVKDKMKQTNLERYGAEYYSQTDERDEKVRNTCLEKYGVDSPTKMREVQEKMKATLMQRHGVEHALQSEKFKKKFRQTCLDRYGKVYPNKTFGKAQEEIREWVNKLGFNFSTNHDVLNGKEIDLYDDNVGLGIEYCGLHWHNEMSPSPKLRSYHCDKYKKCLDVGIRLITLFEDEWLEREEQCKSFIASSLGIYNRRVYARKCSLVEITKAECDNFCDANHIQGSSKFSLARFALIDNDEIALVLSLGQHHYKKPNGEVILDRLCSKAGVQIVGGVSRAFDKSVTWAKENGFSKIVSWSDNRWTEGSIYNVLGFELDAHLPPDYSYVNSSKHIRVSKQSQNKKATSRPDGMTEKEWCFCRDLVRMWDCGKKRWIYKLS